MNRPRRALLRAGVAAGSALLAGCIATAPGGSGADAPTSRPDGTAARTTRSTTTPLPKGGDTVAVKRTITNDDLEYVESNETVRYVARWTRVENGTTTAGEPPERKPVYESIPFEKWGKVECAHVGAKRAAAVVRERLDYDGGGVSAGVTTEGGEKVIRLSVVTVLDRDGDVVSKPGVPYEALERVAPAAVRATVRFGGREYTDTVPVTTTEETRHLT